jgi:hypothetical protein
MKVAAVKKPGGLGNLVIETEQAADAAPTKRRVARVAVTKRMREEGAAVHCTHVFDATSHTGSAPLHAPPHGPASGGPASLPRSAPRSAPRLIVLAISSGS